MTRRAMPLVMMVVCLATGCVGPALLAERNGRARYEDRRFGRNLVGSPFDAPDEACSCGHSQCDGHHATTVIVVHDEEG